MIAPLRAAAYEDPLRRARMEKAAKVAEIVPAAPFGSQAFLEVMAGGFDVLCHHAAEAANHKAPDFDVARAVAGNTFNAAAVLAAARSAGVRRLVLTGSVFEEGEGRGTQPLVAFSPYGLSKTLTARAFAAECDAAGLPMVKFVVPNPFGPYEAQTFQRLVMSRWREGQAVRVSHPLYGRDNAPADLLGQVYARAATGALGAHVSPSVYAGPVGGFFQRMAREVRARTGWACDLDLADSQQSTEPLERYNLQPVDPDDYGWSQGAFWDAYAAYYAEGG